MHSPSKAVDPGSRSDGEAPAAAWERDATRRALDELFTHAHRYKSSAKYFALLEFVGRFRFYAPFNAMLVYTQLPGATFVAPAHRWFEDYDRRLKADARPLVILQTMGPAMFVFDVSDTEPLKGARALPPEVERPFDARPGSLGDELSRTVQSAMRDGVEVVPRAAGSQSAGAIQPVGEGRRISFVRGVRPPRSYSVPLRYEVLLNDAHLPAARYATLIHELAHLYCGHLGTPNASWWPDRRGLPHDVRELEAESVCYLVCRRLGIDSLSNEYLSAFVDQQREMPTISLDCVMKAAGLIEQMGREIIAPRKETKQ